MINSAGEDTGGSVRIARFAHPRGMSFGVVEGSGPTDAMTVAEIQGHPFGEIVQTGQRWALPDVRLLSPILPSKVVGIGRNYADHARELGNEVPERPMLFLKPSTSVIGPEDPIRLPAMSQQVEHEAELAIVIGATGARRVDKASAAHTVFGVTAANDVTARDLQPIDVQFTRAKGFDSFCPLGPWIETDLAASGLSMDDLGVRCEVDGQVRQDGRTRDLMFDIPTLIAYVSQIMTLLPGDVILTGTPPGVGPLTAGSIVNVTVEGVGTLSNPVLAEE